MEEGRNDRRNGRNDSYFIGIIKPVETWLHVVCFIKIRFLHIIPHYRVGRLIRFKLAEVEVCMKTKKQEFANIPIC